MFAVNTIFNLCDMWITDTSYRNLRLLNTNTENNPVYLRPIMMHFTKKEKNVSQFVLELFSERPSLKNLKQLVSI